MTKLRELAVFTTVYSGVRAYLDPWYRSVESQVDHGFDLWVALDDMLPGDVMAVLGKDPDATWVHGRAGDTPARIRQRALAAMVDRYDAVVFVDADDVMLASRVAAARSMLDEADVTACSLRMVDAEERDLGVVMRLPETGVDDVLPLSNVFGLSNTAYRGDVLRRMPAIPGSTRSVDWFLATHAWLAGAIMHLDPDVHMLYRQHGSNMTVVRPPFTASHVQADSRHVRQHLATVIETAAHDARQDRLDALRAALEEVAMFQRRVVDDACTLEAYLEQLNRLPWLPRWFAHVARPELREMWTGAPLVRRCDLPSPWP